MYIATVKNFKCPIDLSQKAKAITLSSVKEFEKAITKHDVFAHRGGSVVKTSGSLADFDPFARESGTFLIGDCTLPTSISQEIAAVVEAELMPVTVHKMVVVA